MGEDQADPQKLKKIAAAAYDYDKDPRWGDYWSNILIPPHMASRSDVVLHFKRKFYQRYIDPGLVVEPMSLTGSSQSTRQTSSSASSTSMPATEQGRPRTSASSSRTSRSGNSTTSSAGPNPTTFRWDRRTVQFAVNAWIFIMAVLAMLPLMPGNISNRAYHLCFIGTACTSLYSLYSLYGKPRAWNLQSVQLWLQSVIVTKDFIQFMYSLVFMTSHLSLKFALLPILCRSLDHVAKFLRHNFNRSTLYRKYLEDLCVWVESNTTTLSILSSHAEVGLGFLLIISLFSWQRNFIQAFMYWHLLKLMYHAPATAGYHKSVWTKIGNSVYPSINRYAPFLKTPLSFVQQWWVR